MCFRCSWKTIIDFIHVSIAVFRVLGNQLFICMSFAAFEVRYLLESRLRFLDSYFCCYLRESRCV